METENSILLPLSGYEGEDHYHQWFFQDLCNDRLESRLRGSSCKASAKYLKKVHQYCSTCCPTFIHVGLANALDLPETEEAVCKMVDAFAKRREVLIEGLDQIPGITYVKPEGAFMPWWMYPLLG